MIARYGHYYSVRVRKCHGIQTESRRVALREESLAKRDAILRSEERRRLRSKQAQRIDRHNLDQ